MSDDFNNDSLLELYLYESTSLLESLDDILLKAESAGDLTSENLNEIFRIMHTIKGSSAMMAYNGISEVAHKTEDLFSFLRNSGLNKEHFNDLFDIVLAVSDFLKTEVAKIQDGQPLETEVSTLTDILTNLIDKMREGAAEEAPKMDLGRTLGAPMPSPVPPAQPVSQPEPAGVSQPEPINISQPEPVGVPQPEPIQSEQIPASAPALPPEVSMPEAPEGGRILGMEPPPGTASQRAFESDELAADISKITSIAQTDEHLPGEATTYNLHVHFNEGSKMENIRAFMLVNKLNEKGTVNRTIPPDPESNPDAASAIADRGFYVSYTTTLFREQIETLIKGTLSVETVAFVRRMPDEPAGSEPASIAPKPEPRPQPIPVPPEASPHGMGQPMAQSHVPVPQTPVSTDGTDHIREALTPSESQRPVFVDVTQNVQTTPAQNFPAQQRPVFVDVTKPVHPAAPQPGAMQQNTQPQQIQPTAQTHAPQNLQPDRQAPVSQADLQTRKLPSEQTTNIKTTTPEKIPASVSQQHGATNQSFISVELKKLDTLLDLVGEIVINESIVTENPDLDGLELTNFRKASRQLDKLTNELQDTVMAIRMLPVSNVFQRMRRIVRDMCKSLGKEAELVLVGETTEVDKTIIDALADPIMHLVRNAMDHAIESPEERVNAGKNPLGHIILSAQNSGGDVIISVSDDGKGLDKESILDKARANGLLRKPESEYSEREIFNLLMVPGFSTRENVSEYSGRGVGLDVVKYNIEKIGGSVIVESKKGFGTNVILKIPLTLAIISCIEIAIGKDIYSIPINNIRESFKSSAGQLITDPSGGEMIMLRGAVYPIIRLYETFGCSDALTNIEDGILILVDAGDSSACLLADSLVGKFQVVVKPLPNFLNRFNIKRSGTSGCTIMGNGNISLILNVQDLVE